MAKHYSQIIYESKPLGKEKIKLFLTTLNLKKIKNGESKKIEENELKENDFLIYTPHLDINKLWKEIEKFIKKTYGKQVEEMRQEIEKYANVGIYEIENRYLHLIQEISSLLLNKEKYKYYISSDQFYYKENLIKELEKILKKEVKK